MQSKKTNTKSSTIKTSRRRRKSTTSTSSKKNIFIVLGVFLMISMVAFGYFLGQQNSSNSKTPKKLLDNLAKIKTLKRQVPKKEEHRVSNVLKKEPKVHLVGLVGKPKLVIIIDDISKVQQLKNIEALGMKITPSIFPPFKYAPATHTLARGLKHYMIHLPMESGKRKFNTQLKTLRRTSSDAVIIARVKELRVLFPTARYVNNHTGSVFTEDGRAMLTLYTALREEGFMFMDSRTTGATKVPNIAKKFGDVYLGRDVFIDNVHNVKTIHKQLEKAVKIAKKKGYAIVIGHPHTATFQALLSAGSILKDVELVYIDNLMTI